MPIATSAAYAEMIARAKAGRFAYPAINVSSSQTLNAALRGFADAGSDGIVQVSTGGAEYLSGPTINVQDGALVTASGGGDLATYEFVPGTGGSKDVLAGLTTFAIIPSYRGPLPKDTDWGVTSLAVGNSVYLSGIPGLAAGTYTLLPGHYALLPGAFRVTLNTDNRLMSDTTMTKEFEAAANTFSLSLDDFEKITINAMKSAFLPYDQRCDFIYSVIKPGYAKVRASSAAK